MLASLKNCLWKASSSPNSLITLSEQLPSIQHLENDLFWTHNGWNLGNAKRRSDWEANLAVEDDKFMLQHHPGSWLVVFFRFWGLLAYFQRFICTVRSSEATHWRLLVYLDLQSHSLSFQLHYLQQTNNRPNRWALTLGLHLRSPLKISHKLSLI